MKKNKLLLLVTALVYLFLIGPLLVIMAASFSDTNYLKFPGEGFTLKWYQQVFAMSAFASAAKLSVLIALGGTAIALALGLPAAYALNRYDFKGKDTSRPFPFAGADSVHRAGLRDAALCGQSI